MIDVKEFKLGQDFSSLRVLAGEYSFIVFGLQTVRVRVWFSATPHGYCTTQSHFFGACREVPEETRFEATEEKALHRAMMTFVTLFPPDNPGESDQTTWLAENKDF
jgi:hypothetical protein